MQKRNTAITENSEEMCCKYMKTADMQIDDAYTQNTRKGKML